MSIKIPKIYENEEKKDFEYPDLINYDDIQYTPNSLEDVNKTQGDQFAQNIIDIDGNITDIAVNASGIAVNVFDISGNATDISINASGIGINVIDINGNTSNITINANGISANVFDIAGNTSNITINADGISTNVTNITTAQNTAEDAQDDADTAQLTADTAQADANTAQGAADAAQGTADANDALLDDIANDTKITPVEKLTAKPIWDDIVVEGTPITGTIPVQATLFGVSDVDFDTAYSALNVYLNTTLTVFANMTTTTTIVRADWDTAWDNYWNERTLLLNAIAEAAKDLADAAQTDADTAQGTADGKVKTFIQDSIPTSVSIGDIWFDSDNNNRVYRADCVGADEIAVGEWELTRDTGIEVNTSNITQNADHIALNVTNISTNAGDVTTNQSNISINADGISSNVTSISNNAGDISTNQSNITQTADQIQLKVSDSTSTKASVTVGNINGGTVRINGQNIILDGDTQVDGDFSVSGNVLSGGTITGVTFKTSASGKRVELASDDIDFYDLYDTNVGYIHAVEDYLMIHGKESLSVYGHDALFLWAGTSTSITLGVSGILVEATMATQFIYPETNNSYNLGGSSNNWDNLFINDIYYGSTWMMDFKTNGGPTFKTDIYIASGKKISGNIIPTSDSNFDIGTDTLRYAKVYADQFPASPIKVAKSGIETFRKIGKIKKSKDKYTLETSALPEEFKITDEKGVQHTELKRTIGITVQTVGELIEKTDDLEAKVNQLINK